MASATLTFTAEELDLLTRAALNEWSSWGDTATEKALADDPMASAFLAHSQKLGALYQRLHDARAKAEAHEARAVLDRVEAE